MTELLCPANFRISRPDDGSRVYTINSSTNDTLFDDLSDALYIEEELSPYGRDWKSNLKFLGFAIFSYHGLELVKVECTSVWNVFKATDI